MDCRKNRKLALVSPCIVALFILLAIGNSLAGTAALSWNVNSESDLAGYRVYYGTSHRTSDCPPTGYSNVVDVGNVTTHSLLSLSDDITCHPVATMKI